MGYRENHGPADRYFVDTLAFMKQYRHRGIVGLLAPLLSMIREMGYKSINIYCADKSIDGLDLPGFYKKFGFVELSYSEEKGHEMELKLK
jgi:ribosomal protein S18 acetylase RimI-like enzyme